MKKYVVAGFCIAIIGICWSAWRNLAPDSEQLGNIDQLTAKYRRNTDKNADPQIALGHYYPVADAVNKPVNKNAKLKPQQSNADSHPLKPYASKSRTKSKNTDFSSPKIIWQQWQIILERSDYQQIPIITAELSRALQQHPDPQIYDTISAMLSQGDMPNDKKALVLDLLSEIATPEALEQLLNLTAQGMESTLYLQVLQAISRIGDNHWQGRYHNELSPMLESAWLTSTNKDPTFYIAIGQAIARIGDPQGINQLLITLSTHDDNQNKEIQLIKQQAAFNAIPQIRNPNAVSILGAWLADTSVGAPAFEVSGAALVEIGTPEATEKIFDWAKGAPVEGVRNLQGWLLKIDDQDTLQKIAATKNQAFRSQEMEQVVNQFAVNSTVVTMQPNSNNNGINATTSTSTSTSMNTSIEQ